MKKTNLVMIGIFAASLLALPAFALELRDAKAQGLVGEKIDGYLGVVKSTPEAEALAQEINSKRKEFYNNALQNVADKKLSLADIAKRAGERAIAETPAGQYVNTGSGWTKK